MSFGPRVEPEPETVPVADAADLATWAAGAAFEHGRAAGRQEADWEIAAALLDQNEAYRAPGEAEQEMAAYGEMGREHFGDPRPGDYPGQQNENEAEAG